MFKFLFEKFYYSPLWIPRSFQKKKTVHALSIIFQIVLPYFRNSGERTLDDAHS